MKNWVVRNENRLFKNYHIFYYILMGFKIVGLLYIILITQSISLIGNAFGGGYVFPVFGFFTGCIVPIFIIFYAFGIYLYYLAGSYAGQHPRKDHSLKNLSMVLLVLSMASLVGSHDCGQATYSTFFAILKFILNAFTLYTVTVLEDYYSGPGREDYRRPL